MVTKCQPDTAAVLLLAPGSSFPEFFAGLIGVFFADNPDLGTGTILGKPFF